MGDASTERSSSQWVVYTALGQYGYAEQNWFHERAFTTLDQAEAFLDGPAHDFPGSILRRDNGWYGPIEMQALSTGRETFTGPWLRDVLTISKTDKSETFEQILDVEWKMIGADAIPRVMSHMEREGLLPKGDDAVLSNEQRRLVQGRTKRYRLPELECALGEGWNFFDIETDARRRLGHLNPNDATGYEYRLFSAALDFEDALRAQHRGLTAIDVGHFWTSLQIWVSLAAFCRTTLWNPHANGSDIEAARRVFFKKLGSYVYSIQPERYALSNRPLAEAPAEPGIPIDAHRSEPISVAQRLVPEPPASSQDKSMKPDPPEKFAEESGGCAANAPVEPEPASASPDLNINTGPSGTSPSGQHPNLGLFKRRPKADRPLPRPPSRVGGYATVSPTSRAGVTGAIKYSFPLDFPASSCDRVKTAEISAAREFNEKINGSHHETEVRALHASCVMRPTLVFCEEAIKLRWGAHRIDNDVRDFVSSAKKWARFPTDSEAQREFEESEQWKHFQDLLVGLSDTASPAELGSAGATAQLEPGTANSGHRSLREDAEQDFHDKPAGASNATGSAVIDSAVESKPLNKLTPNAEPDGTTAMATEPLTISVGKAKHFGGRAVKRSRAKIVARLINELDTLKPQMFEDKEEYSRLSAVYPGYLTFEIAERRPDLKTKILAIQNSARHIMLAQELAAAHTGRQLATLQDDWKRHKPDKFKLQR